MKKKLLNSKDFAPACGICAHGRISPDNESVLCVNTGIRKLDSKCRKFVYDPLKRKPKRPNVAFGEFDKGDFEL